ncbi:peptidoglycan bridge formation glycyltransferase FemA/FemB family protein [Patescibacteria group bacterium]|nr:MAG: peptidoglycan bridge formation glycyltransferase FemA/FemB family protein [Patescibacteria group bacterium]
MSPQEWNRAALAHAPVSGAFLQSWQWGEFQRNVGREVRRYEQGGVAAQVVSRPLPGGLTEWDVFRAPFTQALAERLIGDLKKTNGTFLHVEAAASAGVAGGTAAAARLPEHTLLLDLTQSEEALLAAMHHKTRYNLRLAQKHGVTVRIGGAGDWPAVWQIFAATAKRDGFSLHPEGYYQKMLTALAGPLEDAQTCTAHLVIAEHEDDLLAGMILIRFGDTATYLHGASADLKRNLMAPYLLHGEAMRIAKLAGCTRYDFWGVAPPDAPASHRWTGITRFKTGFGGQRVSLPGAQELPLRPFWYTLYRLANRLRGK